jgi:hypothetical protein
MHLTTKEKELRNDQEEEKRQIPGFQFRFSERGRVEIRKVSSK